MSETSRFLSCSRMLGERAVVVILSIAVLTHGYLVLALIGNSVHPPIFVYAVAVRSDQPFYVSLLVKRVKYF